MAPDADAAPAAPIETKTIDELVDHLLKRAVALIPTLNDDKANRVIQAAGFIGHDRGTAVEAVAYMIAVIQRDIDVDRMIASGQMQPREQLVYQLPMDIKCLSAADIDIFVVENSEKDDQPNIPDEDYDEPSAASDDDRDEPVDPAAVAISEGP